MVETSTLITFVTVVLGLFLIPGPAVLLVFTRTAQGGARAGILAGLGIAVGDLVHTTAAALGLSAIMMTSSMAFNIVKLAGAAYLIYLGVKAMLQKNPDPSLPQQLRQVRPGQVFLQAIPIEVLNPKTALFFLSFFPQFVHPENGAVLPQFLLLGCLFVAMSAAYTTSLALLAKSIGRFLGRIAWLGRWQGKIIGCIFIALGLRVALQSK